MKNLSALIIVFIALVSAPLASAIELGDPAPPLKISDWVKGKAVDLAALKGKQIVVVEFWATWCPPCRESIPHLTEMQKKFKDVVFVGVSDEDAEMVKGFVKKMGSKMDYTVAVDDEQKTSEAYMGAFGLSSIPTAFIVDKEGRIVWNGHPMAELETALEQVIAGKFDIAKARTNMGQVQKMGAARQKLQQFYQAIASGADEETIQSLGKELEKVDKEIGGFKPGEKLDVAEMRKQIRFEVTLREYQTAVTANRPDSTLTLLEKQLQEFGPKDFKLDELKDALTVNRTFTSYYQAITGRGDTNQIPELAKKLSATKIQHYRALDEWAWTILTDERVQIRDFNLAAKLAKAAVDASDSKEPSPLETYARALSDLGKNGEAVSVLKKAIEVTKTEESRKALEERLKQYQEKEKTAAK